jgi:hypothetical protein
MQLGCSTVLTYNDEIRLLIEWFVIYRFCKEDFRVEQVDVYAVNRVLATLRKMYSKQRKRENVQKKENTVEELKGARKWPMGGFKELAKTVSSEIEWAKRVCESRNLDSYTINCFMQLLAASFYTSKWCSIVF